MTAPRTPLARSDLTSVTLCARAQLWDAVAAGDADAALRAVEDAHAAGLDPETLLVSVVAEVQRQVGAAWAENRMTVAQEHAATAINDRVVSALGVRHSLPSGPARGRVTVACVDGEWHALPARLLAEVLRLRGWEVDYLGAQTPTRHLVAHLHHTDAEAVLLSSSLAVRLPAAHGAITACQAIGVPVMVGGAAFGPDGRYARLLGADRWAATATEAAELLAEGLPARPAAVRQTVDDLPHLVDQEYTFVNRSRPRLVRRTLAELAERYPPMRQYDEDQRERTAEDIAHIVEFLGAALYVDDIDLFCNFLAWTGDILAVRGVLAASLLPMLEALLGLLRDFPRAVGMLRAGFDTVRRATAAAPAPPRPRDPA